MRPAAIRLDRELARVEGGAVRAALTVGNRARRAALDALRTGESPSAAAAAELARMGPIITGTLLEAHARGALATVQRAQTAIRSRGRVHAARTPLDGAVEFLRRQHDASDAEIDALQGVYGREALSATGQFTRSVERMITAEVAGIIRDGDSVRRGSARLRGVFDRAGIQADNPYRLESIVRTESAKAFSAGRWNALQDNPIAFDLLWGFRYETVADTRVRPSHAAMQGTTLPKDDPFWRDRWPPNGWGCRCQAVELFSEPATIRRPAPILVDGDVIRPQPDPGFGVNHGEVFRGPPLAARSRPGRTRQDPPRRAPRRVQVTDQPGGAVVQVIDNAPRPRPAPLAAAPPAQPGTPAPATATVPTPRPAAAPAAALADPGYAVDVRIRGRTGEAARATLADISRVHRLPDNLDTIPVQSYRPRKPGEQGVFVYTQGGGEPLRISLNTRGVVPHTTLAHEVAHMIDLAAIGPSGGFESRRPGGLLSGVIEAAGRSAAAATLRARALTASTATRRHIEDYLLDPSEIWARAYAQWIARRGGSAAIRREINLVQQFDDGLIQWHDADFAPIAAEIDRVMERLGWTI